MTQDVTLLNCHKSPFSFFSAQKSIHTEEKQQNLVSLYVSGKLPTYPSHNPSIINAYFSLTAKCWLKGGVGGQFPRNVLWSQNLNSKKKTKEKKKKKKKIEKKIR